MATVIPFAERCTYPAGSKYRKEPVIDWAHVITLASLVLCSLAMWIGSGALALHFWHVFNTSVAGK